MGATCSCTDKTDTESELRVDKVIYYIDNCIRNNQKERIQLIQASK